MADDKTRMEAALEALRQDYRHKLPTELQMLRGVATRLSCGEQDHELLEELHHRLHKLAGSGGTFGLHALSMECRKLEQRVKQWLQQGMGGCDIAARSAFAQEVAALAVLLEREDETPAKMFLSQQKTTHDGHLIHVWMVEEDAALGKELMRLLSQFGFNVRLFTRLDDATDAAGKERPDVMIMDVVFSDMAAQAKTPIRMLLHPLSCPLILLSAQDDFESRVKAARLGAEGFLLKPIDLPKLVDRLERIFELHHADPYRVLVVDDDVTLAEHYCLVLRGAGMEVERICDPRELIKRIGAFHPELVLMDMQMPGYSGPELAMVIRQYDEWLGLPVIYLSAEADVDVQLTAMGHGADDFLTKPISDSHLVAAVQVRAARARQLSELMSKDSLTGLLKHSLIKDALQNELAHAQRIDKPFCVVMLDIDHFKRVNDSYGHPVGDRVIRAVAQLLKQRLRKSDTLGRYGGEEFALLLPECDEEVARALLDDIRQRFASLLFQYGDMTFSCTLSAGIACSTRFPTFDGGELLNAADGALYVAKHSGRNRVSVAQ